MKRAFLVFLCLFCLLGSTFGISSSEAVNFVVRENSFLIEGENFQTPVTTIKNEQDNYWVIPVLSGQSAVTYFPVKEKVKALSTNRAVNRELFKTADILRELSIEKERVSQNTSVDWLFTQTYVLLFDNLSRSLGNEVFQLNTIASSVNDSQTNSKVGILKSALESMSERAARLSLLITDGMRAESSFQSQPSMLRANDLKEKFEEFFSELSLLNDDALAYRSEINSLKDLISTSSADDATKTRLISLADPPAEFNTIGNYLLDASEISSAVESVFSRVNAKIDALLNVFDQRIKRNDAYTALFGSNSDVLSKTDNKFLTENDLVEFVLSTQNRPYWKQKALLHSVESNWLQAKRNFNDQEYDDAKLAAQSALNAALKIYNGGVIDTNSSQPLLSDQTIFQIVTALVVLLVLLFAYNNRKKIFQFVNQSQEGKEVDIGGFE